MEQEYKQAIAVLKALDKHTDMDYCGLFEAEVLDLICNAIKGSK